MAVNPINPNSPIPNTPFYWPQESSFQTPQGPLIFGAGISVDYATGIVNVDPVPPSSLGTVTLVTGGPGIVTAPVGGITGSGSVRLATVPGLTPGTYSYPVVSVDIYGRITSIVGGTSPVQAITGTYPIIVTGGAPSIAVSIAAGSTTNAGAVQLADNTSTPSTTLALTAYQGYLLQNQINAIAATASIQFLAGTLNASSGNVVTATTQGISAGITAGTSLPAASASNIGAVMLVTTAGTYTPPGGVAQAAMPGDQYLSDGGSWMWFKTGFRANYATTTTSGIVRLATVPEVQALADNTIAVTPFGLSGMVASTTQQGFVELATDAETQLLSSTTLAITPSSLGSLQASPSQRGIVQLNDTLTSTSTTEAPTARALKEAYDSSIQNSIIQANGDLIVGRVAGDPQILSKGINGQVLTVDNTQPLGVAWKDQTLPLVTPVGAMSWFSSNDPAKLPVGWLVADGSSYVIDSTNPYYLLFQVIGTTFNLGGDPPGTFRVPDLRGQFIRGWNDAGGNPGTLDPGRAFGQCQTGAYAQHNHLLIDPGHCHAITDVTHTHTVSDPGHTHPVNDPGHSHDWNVTVSEVVGNTAGFYDGNGKQGSYSGSSTLSSTGITGSLNACSCVTIDAASTGLTATVCCVSGITICNSPTSIAPGGPNETRPVNLALLPIIKYRDV